LNRFKALKASLASLASAEHLASVTEQLAELQSETDELSKSAVPAKITADQIRELEEKAETLKVRVNTLSDTQTRRSQMLATGFQKQQEKLEPELRQLQAEKEELKKQTDAGLTTADPGEQKRLHLKHERVDVQTGAAQLALEMLPMEQQENELLSKQDERLLEASRKKLEALNRRLTKLRGAQSRSRLETLQLEREEAGNTIETLLLDLRILSEKALVYYFQRPKDIETLQRRFPQRALERTAERVSLSKAYWDRTNRSLEYFSGEDLAGLKKQLHEESVDTSASLAMVRTRLARTMDESQDLQAVRENVRKRFSYLADKLSAELATLDTHERARCEGEMTSLRVALEELMRTAIKSWEDVAGRLNEALAALEEHEAYLQDVGRKLRWRRITTRDPGVIGADWEAARAELVELLRGRQAERNAGTEKEAREEFHDELFGERSDSGAEVRGLIRAGRADVAAASGGDWAWVVSSVVLSVVIGLLLYWGARSKGIHLAREIVDQYGGKRSCAELPGHGLSMRVNLMALNMVGDVAVPVLLALAIVFSAWRLLDERMLREAIFTVLALFAAAIITLRLVHHLFEAYSPPHRPIPCSDTVAKHYRRWLSLLILLSLVALPVPLLLGMANAAPALSDVFLEVYKICFLALLLVFLVRKERVLGLGDMRHRHWGMMVVWIVYPLAIVCVALLLVLQLLGFGALVATAGTGLLLAVGIVVAMGTVTEYLADLMDRHMYLPVRGSGQPRPDVGGDAGDLDESRTRYSVKLLKALIRLAGLAAAVFLILWAWDIPVRSQGLAWQKFAFGAVVILPGGAGLIRRRRRHAKEKDAR